MLFFGTGKQATNIVLCIRKQLTSPPQADDLEFIGVGCRDHTLDAFSSRLNDLFPNARRTVALHSDTYVPNGGPSIGFIASPPDAHGAGVSWMLRHGVDRIVIEKPIASTHGDLEAIGSVLRSEPDRVCIQEQYLYSQLYDELIALAKDPTLYIAERTGVYPLEPLTITGTVAQFYKRRVKDLHSKRHAENICLLELPHILTLLHNAFGAQSVASLTVDDLHYRSRIYRGYKKASIVVHDRQQRQHRIELSNVDRCRRVMNVELSDGTNVALHFPGRLRHESTVFESRVAITRGRKLIYEKSYADDHLATAVRHYLRWRDIRGTYERCYEPSRLVIDLAGM